MISMGSLMTDILGQCCGFLGVQEPEIEITHSDQFNLFRVSRQKHNMNTNNSC